jgi:hypothetical protein
MVSDGVSVVIIVKVNIILYSGKKVKIIRWLVTFFFVALQHKLCPSLLIAEVSRSCTILNTQNRQDSLNE